MFAYLTGKKRQSLNLKTLNNKSDGKSDTPQIDWENQGNKFEEIDQCLRRNSLTSTNNLLRITTPSSPPSFVQSELSEVPDSDLVDRLSVPSSKDKK